MPPHPSSAVPDRLPSVTLLPHHQATIDGAAISPKIAAQRRYRSVTADELVALRFASVQRRPGLLIPGYGVDGRNGSYQLRPDVPRLVDGKPLKYETPAGARNWLDVHPAMQPLLSDPRVPLWITEGIKKADAAASQGMLCISLQGVYGWRGTNEHGGKTALPDWELVALNDRIVYLVFDSDAVTNRNVRQAEQRLKRFLESRGAHVFIVRLPAGPDGAKVGLDDFLKAGHTPADLEALIERGPAAGEVLPLEAYLDTLPDDAAGPARSNLEPSDELARLRAENERLKRRDRHQREKLVRLMERDRLVRRLLRDRELSDGEKVQAMVMADMTEQLAEKPAPTGEYRVSLDVHAPAAGASKQTFSRRMKALQRTGALAVRVEADRQLVRDAATGKLAYDPATGRPVQDIKSRLYITPRATGAEFLRLVVDRTYAAGPVPERKQWGGARPSCKAHPTAAVIATSTTVYRCQECGDEVKRTTSERTIAPLPLFQVGTRAPAPTAAAAARSILNATLSSTRDARWNDGEDLDRPAPPAIVAAARSNLEQAATHQPGQPTLRILGAPPPPPEPPSTTYAGALGSVPARPASCCPERMTSLASGLCWLCDMQAKGATG